MTATKVTIAIPTYNRAQLLRRCIESALDQDYSDLQVMVFDNNSVDNTESVVRCFHNPKVTYFKNNQNVGLYRNWRRALQSNVSPYLCILQDDDLLLPGFVRESVNALEQHTGAGFSTVRTRAIGIDGAPFDARARELSDPKPPGVMRGLDFLTGVAAGKKWIIPSSGVMLRAAQVQAVGGLDHPHCKDTIDTNLFMRLAAVSDVVMIPEILCEVRFHSSRESQIHFDSSAPTGPIASLSERIDAIGYLLRSRYAQDATFREWLAERLLALNQRRSRETQVLIPPLNYSWDEMLDTVKGEIEELIPAGESFLLADANKWGLETTGGRRAVPFPERDGQYWGAPADDACAIDSLERSRAAGARIIVFGWPAFWWLDYYTGLREHLSHRYCRVVNNSRMQAYNLEKEA